MPISRVRCATGIQQGKDGRIDADPEAQREQRHCRKSRRFRKHPERVTHVRQKSHAVVIRRTISNVTRIWADLARISHTLSAAARDKAASTSLRSLTVLDVLFKYASAR
jgi:hypothetical protein